MMQSSVAFYRPCASRYEWKLHIDKPNVLARDDRTTHHDTLLALRPLITSG